MISGSERSQLLWPGGAPGAKGEAAADRPTLAAYPAPVEQATGAAVVVFPGGGYGSLADDHEGRQIAAWLNNRGITTFILRYRIGPRYGHPAPLQDARRAVRTVRARAEEWRVASDRIGVWGFSAGGHLASTIGTQFDSGDPGAADPIERVSCRPDFLILAYPVISMVEASAHAGSRRNLLGEEPAVDLMEQLSSERRVTPETPPSFLFHTDEDPAVPAEHSVLFYLALRRAGVPAELHIYERGRHGVGLAPDDPVLASWSERLVDWLRLRGVIRIA